MRGLLLLLIMSSAANAADLLPDQPRTAKQDAIYGQALYSLHSGDYATALTLNNKLRKRGQRGY